MLALLRFSHLHTYSKDHQVHTARALVVLSLLIFVSVLSLVVGVCTAITEQSSAQLFWPPPNPTGDSHFGIQQAHVVVPD